VPHLHELAPGLRAALGYNGRGVAMATVLGTLLARCRHAMNSCAADTTTAISCSLLKADEL